MKKLLAGLVTILVAAGAMAEPKAFNLSITPDMAVYDRNTVIEGATFSIWGENPQTSFALGFANGSTGQSAGLDWGLILNYADSYKGVKWGMINYTKEESFGWDAGFANYTKNLSTGLFSGIVNYSGRLKGLQFGIVNYAESTDVGVQIGLVNIIRTNNNWFSDLPNAMAPWMIFVNWRSISTTTK